MNLSLLGPYWPHRSVRIERGTQTQMQTLGVESNQRFIVLRMRAVGNNRRCTGEDDDRARLGWWTERLGGQVGRPQAGGQVD